MVEKTNKKKTGGQPPENGGGGGKNNVNTVVLKADLHCEGCVHKVLKCIRSFDGVDDANIGDGQRITVVGKVDPAKLRERVEEKTHKKIELVSPPPQNKKDDNKNEGSNKCKENSGGAAADNAKQDKCKEDDKNSKNKNSDEKKSKQKEIPVSTAVLKVHLHCEGCIQKICKLVTKTKGYQDVKVDRQKGMVTVTGAIDMKGLAQVLKKHLKREVEVTPPPQKKEAEKKENTGGGEKGKGGGGDKVKSGNNKAESGGGGGGGGGDKVKSGSSKGESGDKVKSGGGDGGGNGGEMGAGGEKVEGSKIQFQVGYPYPYTYEPGVIDQFHYNMYAFGPYHGPQMFSDENPNACTIM
ncbi:hypothetical protein ABFS83_04G201100 [Erythranthe nasuta]